MVAAPFLWSGIVNRAEQNLWTNQEQESLLSSRGNVDPLEVAAVSTMDESSSSILSNIPAVVTANDVAKNYGNNPTIATAALAYSLWSYVLRPDVDTAIDATAGNGGGSVALAKLLFPSTAACHPDTASTRTTTSTRSMAHFRAVDIQEQACANTARKLAAILPENILQHNV
jgi:hypothetical protein